MLQAATRMGHALAVPWGIARTVVGLVLFTRHWHESCAGEAFILYVVIAMVSIIFACIPEVMLMIALGNFLFVAIPALELHPDCVNSLWWQYTVVDMAIVAGILSFVFTILLTTKFIQPNLDSTYRATIRFFGTPVCMARFSIAVYLFATDFSGGCAGAGIFKLYILISMFSWLYTVRARILILFSFISAAIGIVGLITASRECREDWFYLYTLLDCGLNITLMPIVYLVWFCVLKPLVRVVHKAKVFAAFGVGIPLSLLRLLGGYILCMLEWSEGCQGIEMYKIYVVCSMLTFIPVPRPEIFGGFMLLLSLAGFAVLLYFEGCQRWRAFVVADLCAGLGVAGVVYLLWVNVEYCREHHDPDKFHFYGRYNPGHKNYRGPPPDKPGTGIKKRPGDSNQRQRQHLDTILSNVREQDLPGIHTESADADASPRTAPIDIMQPPNSQGRSVTAPRQPISRGDLEAALQGEF